MPLMSSSSWKDRLLSSGMFAQLIFGVCFAGVLSLIWLCCKLTTAIIFISEEAGSGLNIMVRLIITSAVPVEPVQM